MIHNSLKTNSLQLFNKNKSQNFKKIAFHIPKKRTFATQNFELIWQNRTQNKEMRGLKT